MSTSKNAPALPGQSRTWWLIGAAAAVGAGLLVGSALMADFSPILFLAPAGVVLAALVFAMRPPVFVNLLLVCSLAATALGIYEVPLVAGQTLQVMRVLLLVTIVAALLAGMPLRRRLRPSAVLVLLFALYAVISAALLSRNPGTAVSTVVALLFGVVYVVWLPQIVSTERMMRLAIAGLYGAGALLIVFGLYQFFAWFTGIGRQAYDFAVPFSHLLGMTEHFVNPSRTGALFRVTLPFSSSSLVAPCIGAVLLPTLSLLLQGAPRRRVWWSQIALCMALFLLLVATYSRGAWIGFLGGLLVLLRYDRRVIVNRRIWLMALTLVAVGTIGLLLAPAVLDTVFARFDPSVTQTSDDIHLHFLTSALQIVADHPIVGAGWGNYEYATGILHAHNVYATVLAEGGIVGLGLMLTWMAAVFYDGHTAIRRSPHRSYRRSVAIGLLAAYTSVLINNFFQQSLYSGFFWAIIGLIGAAWFIAGQDAVREQNQGSQSR